jgi:hypothetical protein
MLASCAASEALDAALWMMAIASTLADGAGEDKAAMREDSSARVSVWEKETGVRSFRMRETRIFGSCCVVLRMDVSFGRSVGRRGGMLDSGSC